MVLKKVENRLRRHIRVRSKISGTKDCPRLHVFRSNTAIYAQLIDDTTGTVLASANDLKISSGSKVEKAAQVGASIAESAKSLKIKSCVFDRGGFLYTGRVKSLADGARQGGLSF